MFRVTKIVACFVIITRFAVARAFMYFALVLRAIYIA